MCWAIFCCSRFFSIVQRFTAQLPGILCYVAIQSCSLDSLICACTLIKVCKKRNFWKAKRVKERAKWVNGKSKIGRVIEHKRKACSQGGCIWLFLLHYFAAAGLRCQLIANIVLALENVVDILRAADVKQPDLCHIILVPMHAWQFKINNQYT